MGCDGRRKQRLTGVGRGGVKSGHTDGDNSDN